MLASHSKLFPALLKFINELPVLALPAERRHILQALIDHVQSKLEAEQPVNLNFICTHNSRRSQMAQIWAQTMAYFFQIPVACFSAGTEVTAFNERAVASLKRSGFKIAPVAGSNPIYEVFYAAEKEPMKAFSKTYDDPNCAVQPFTAVLTCSQAEQNCPFIPGAEERIALTYDDPKFYDGSPEEAFRYDERSRQIASEMFYVFSQLKSPS
jgi:arsenate reductase